MSATDIVRTEALGADRATATLHGIDTLVAVPQAYLNFNLATLLKHGTTTDGKPLRDIEFADAAGKHWLKGTVDRLWTELYVPDSPARVRFVLSFSGGTLDYVDNTHAAAVESSCDIKGLAIGFEVDLSRTAVADDASLPQDVRERVSQLLGSLGPGSFGIHQVFMDLQNAALDHYDRSVTVFPAGMPQAAIDALPGYLGQYLARLAKTGGNTLGYAITVGPTADLPATFPPTELKLAVNRYQGGDGKALPDLDTLDYQMITKSGAFPVNPPPWWGNFAVPGDIEKGWYGTLAVSNRLFVQDFLLPRLKLLVLGYMAFSDRDDGTLAPAYEVRAGGFTANQYGGTFESGGSGGRAHRTNIFSNDDVEYAMTVSVQLAVLPGTNKIGISRRTRFDVHYTHWYGIEGHAATSEYRVWYEIPLDITIELVGVQDGKLQVHVTSSTREPDPGVVYGEPYGWDIVDHSGSYPGWASISDDIDAAIATMVEVAAPVAAPPQIAQAIADEFNLQPFVFPGSAQLFLKDAVFNAEGDLLLGLQYKV